ncbi:MAG: hypothetical protein U0531_20960 [Dehalococcoidia bacterium]
MSTATRDASIAAKPGLLRAYSAVAGVVALSVLVQAALAGRGMFVNERLLPVHGYIGNLVFMLVGAEVVLALLAGLPRRARTLLLGHSLLLAVLLAGQTMLGYLGRDGGEAAAWHIANGVLIFGLAITGVTFAGRALRGELRER